MKIKFDLKEILNLLTVIILIAFKIQIIFLAFTFSDGSYYLHMDENLIFRGVSYILNPESFTGFLNSIINGGYLGINSFIDNFFYGITHPGLFFNSHFYGRFTWYGSALVSYFPELFFGEKGQIISTRIFLGLPGIVSFYLISFYLLKNQFIRFFLILILIFSPVTFFYLVFPKPDSFQLLFLH